MAKTVAAGAETTPELARALRAGDRRALARAITLVESTRPDHRRAAQALLTAILPETGRAVRLGVPLLVLHDQDDREVPWRPGAAIAAAAPGGGAS